MTRRGFTLIEMLVTVILLGVFGLLVAQLFHATFMLNYDTANAHNAVPSFNFAAGRMRTDVWSAKKVELKSAHSATVTTAGDSAITWTIDQGVLAREDGSGRDRWTAPPGMTFKLDNDT